MYRGATAAGGAGRRPACGKKFTTSSSSFLPGCGPLPRPRRPPPYEAARCASAKSACSSQVVNSPRGESAESAYLAQPAKSTQSQPSRSDRQTRRAAATAESARRGQMANSKQSWPADLSRPTRPSGRARGRVGRRPAGRLVARSGPSRSSRASTPTFPRASWPAAPNRRIRRSSRRVAARLRSAGQLRSELAI